MIQLLKPLSYPELRLILNQYTIQIEMYLYVGLGPS